MPTGAEGTVESDPDCLTSVIHSHDKSIRIVANRGEFNGMAVLPKDRFEMENFRRHASGIRNIIFRGATDLTKFVYVVRYAVRST